MAESPLPPDQTGPYAPQTGTYGASAAPRGAAETGAVLAGRYQLLAPLGEGGMGTVYLAEQSEPVKRRVAVKLIRAGLDSRAVLARFEAERQALALMDHPNIARVYDGGATAAGQPFFVMEWVPGAPVTRFCDDQRLTPRARLELFVQVCQAVQHAHQKGVIHRDLKPSNVLVTEIDGRPAPKVIDFGVAKATEQRLTDQSLAETGAIVGTPAYMSPEQADPSSMDIDTRTDVYALGVILYELLTGSPPIDPKEFRPGSLLEVLRRVREVEPPRPSTRVRSAGALPEIAANRGVAPGQLVKWLRDDVDWIVMKALEKDRERRYDSANALAADIQRRLADEPVLARPPSAGYRLGKFVRRHRGPVLAAGVASLAVIGAMIGAVYGLVEAGQQREATALRQQAERDRDAANLARDGERKAKQEVEAARAMLARLTYARSVDLALRDWEENHLDAARDLLESCSGPLCGWEWRHVYRLCHEELFRLAKAGLVPSASFSPDGSRVLTSDGQDRVRLWDAATGQEEMSFKVAERGFFPASFSPDGSRVLTVGTTTALWDARTGKLLQQVPEHCSAASFGADGSRLVTVAYDAPRVRVWDARTLKELAALKGPNVAADAAALSPDGARLVTWNPQKFARVWDAKTGVELFKLEGHANSLNSASFSPDGVRIVTAADDNTARVWDAGTGKEVLVLPHPHRVSVACFSPDGAKVLTTCFDTTARLWDAKTGAALRVFRGHTQRPMAAAFSPDGDRIVTAGPDGVRLWDARAGEPAVRLIAVKTNADWAAFPAADRRALSESFSPDGSRRVTSVGEDPTVRVIDVQTGAVLLTLAGHATRPNGCFFSPDGSRIATAGADGTGRVWDARTGAQVCAFQGVNMVDIPPLSFSPDGSHVAGVGGIAGRVWDANTGAEVLALRSGEHGESGEHGLCSALYSADGSRIVTAWLDGTIRVWDAAMAKELLALRGHAGPVMTASFSPDGSRIVSGGHDQTVRVWDAATGAELLTLKGHAHPLVWTAFTPDGGRIMSVDRANEVRVWDGAPLDGGSPPQ